MAKIITDDEMIEKAKDFLRYADADELCHVIGIMFGVECEFDEEQVTYSVTPTNDYCGAFGEIN